MELEFIGAKNGGGGGDNWSYKTAKLQSDPHHWKTNTQLDAFPVVQPTVSGTEGPEGKLK